MKKNPAVIPSRADGEGPPSRGVLHSKKDQASSDDNAQSIAKAIERLRGPSPSARLGMTCVHSHLSYPH